MVSQAEEALVAVVAEDSLREMVETAEVMAPAVGLEDAQAETPETPAAPVMPLTQAIPAIPEAPEHLLLR